MDNICALEYIDLGRCLVITKLSLIICHTVCYVKDNNSVHTELSEKNTAIEKEGAIWTIEPILSSAGLVALVKQ